MSVSQGSLCLSLGLARAARLSSGLGLCCKARGQSLKLHRARGHPSNHLLPKSTGQVSSQSLRRTEGWQRQASAPSRFAPLWGQLVLSTEHPAPGKRPQTSARTAGEGEKQRLGQQQRGDARELQLQRSLPGFLSWHTPEQDAEHLKIAVKPKIPRPAWSLPVIWDYALPSALLLLFFCACFLLRGGESAVPLSSLRHQHQKRSPGASCVSVGSPKPSPRSFPSGAVPRGAPFPIQKQLGGTCTGSRAAAREHSPSPANQRHPHHVFPPRGIDFSPFAYSS